MESNQRNPIRATHSTNDAAARSSDDCETFRFAVGQSWLGTILAAFTDAGVAAILIGEDAGALTQDLQARFPKALVVNAQRECTSPVST